MDSIDRKELLAETLALIDKHSVTAYELGKNTSITAEGVQKIIDRTSKKPQVRTLQTIISYITENYEQSKKLDMLNEDRMIYETITEGADVLKTTDESELTRMAAEFVANHYELLKFRSVNTIVEYKSLRSP